MEETIVPLIIDGEDFRHNSTFDVVSPSTAKTCWKAVSASTEDAIKAVETAQVAFPQWSSSSPTARAEILGKAADYLEANIETLAGYMMEEMGADRGTAQYFVLPLAINTCRSIAARCTTICGSVPVVAQARQSAMIWKEPYGVCLGIVPWNAPYVFGIRSAATAIATGNTCVLKASEMTPRCYWAIGEAFRKAGLGPGVLNIISCRPEDAPKVVNTMVEHPAIKHVDFTGSASTGRKIARVCGENLKPCLMELGGKNSAIVLADADLKKAARECIGGSFLNAGQICMSTDQILVHSSIATQLVESIRAQLAAAARESNAPPNVVSNTSKSRLVKLVSDAVSKGAQVLAGSDSPNDIPGAGFVPTILGSVNQSSELNHEEAFGPLASLRTFETDMEAIRIANAAPYGLSAAVFTRDLRRGLAIAKKLESGAVHINSMTVHDEPALPFGGVKNSGWGRFNSDQGLNEFLVTKSVTWDDYDDSKMLE